MTEHATVASFTPVTTHVGTVDRWSKTIIPTLREAPAEATTPSHQLLLRAGYIRQVAAGVYDYLPLAWRALRKISQIIREEMDAAGGSEMLMPAMAPLEIFDETGRAADYGDDLFQLKDRHGRATVLGPTHEEVITDFLRHAVTSYRQLPLVLYQIQSKFRDEPRPRAGLLRGREFIMKDAYSFHLTVEGEGGLNEAYDAMYRAYSNVFTRCGLDFTAVEAEAGPIGGSASHEFMVNCETGEDTILRCPESGYAANVEKCEIGERAWSFEGDPVKQLKKVHTPRMTTIDEIAAFLDIQASDILKTVVFMDQPQGTSQGEIDQAFFDWMDRSEALLEDVPEAKIAIGADLLSSYSTSASGPEALAVFDELVKERVRAVNRPLKKFLSQMRLVFAVVRGDHEVNEGKIRPFFEGKPWSPIAETLNILSIPVGYISPRFIRQRPGSLLLVDMDAAQGDRAWATGADEPNYHVTGFNWTREMGESLADQSYVKVAEIRNAVVGDPSPRAPGSTLVAQRGIETGHIFKLGCKYSDAMGFHVMDETQKRQSVIMGCYGIGVSRTMAACVEMSHDEGGIIWPAAIAPYHVHIVLMKPDDTEHAALADRLSTELRVAGLDVLLDDRKERPGVKFKDADLIGMPVRLTIGAKALEAGGVECKARSESGHGEVVPLDAVCGRCLEILQA